MGDTETKITSERGEPAAVGGRDVKAGEAPKDVGSLRQGASAVPQDDVCRLKVERVQL